MKSRRFGIAFALALLPALAMGAAPSPKLARGVLPTFVDDGEIVLCKTPPHIENTYEIRVALFLAVQAGKTFRLAVPVGASVDGGLAELVAKWGGEIQRRTCPSFTVSFAYFDGSGKERDSWVLGDETAWKLLQASVHSMWLKERLLPGSKFGGSALTRFRQELSQENFRQQNIDGEDVRAVLLRMLEQDRADGGYLILQ